VGIAEIVIRLHSSSRCLCYAPPSNESSDSIFLSDMPNNPEREGTASLSRPDSLRTRIYASLRTRIHKGEIASGERLVDNDIARQLGVSRMPVREALMQLMHEGYLVSTSRGFMVPQLSAADVTEIFDIRRLLEPEAASLAARHLSPRAEKQLRAAVDHAAGAVSGGSGEEMIIANGAFRNAWLAEVPNRRLADAIERFADQVQLVRQQTLYDEQTQRIVLDGLRGLADALSRRDPLITYERMQDFIAKAKESFLAAQRK
jgi:DNA-binding GntR family transcriptional regulator